MVVTGKTPDGDGSEPDDDGLEIEHEDEDSAEAITRPFDPEKIKVRTIPLLVGQLVSRVAHGEIDLAPDFQRLAGIWRRPQKSRLIESLLLRIPIPVFYVAADDDETWSVVDGLQRTSTICDYVAGEFSLRGLEYLRKFDGHRYKELPRTMQRRINETQLTFNVIEPSTPEEVMFNIFRRINTGGAPLRAQEIRNALHRGDVRDYLKQLAESKEFLTATCNSISPKRMADRECVLRFIAFHIDPWESYSANDLDGFLGEVMEEINRMSHKDRLELAQDFRKAMKAADDIFEQDAFRKRYHPRDRRKPISKALFETWSVGLARLSDREIEVLVHNRCRVVRKSISLLNNDRDFEVAISYATGTPSRIRRRFRAIENLISECMF